MVTNRDIGKGLREISAYLEMEGVGFKPRAYEKAADAVEAMEEPVSKLFAEGGVKGVATVPGVGKSIAEKISEFIETGKVDYLEEMKSRRPVDLMELTAIEGVGPKTVGVLYDAICFTSSRKRLRPKQIASLFPPNSSSVPKKIPCQLPNRELR